MPCGHLMERADLLALVCDVLCRCCHFPIGILGQVWHLIVSIPDLCPVTYFKGAHLNIRMRYSMVSKKCYPYLFYLF